MKDTAIGVALIGYGMIGATYAAALAALQGQVWLTGVLGRSAASGRAFLAAHPALGCDRVYGSVEEIASDGAADFVIVTTPPNTRDGIVATLAQAGKPMLMEKPIERSLQAAAGICATRERHGVPLGIMLQHRASDLARGLRARLAAEEFGLLRAVEIMVPWWRDQGYYDEPGRGTYARDGGGVMITQAIHVMDLAMQFTGPVRDVIALSETTGLHRMEAEDFVSAGVRFENGAVGTLFASTASHPARAEEIVLHYDRATVRGSRAYCRIDRHDGTHESLGAPEAGGSGGDPAAFPARLHRDMIADFAACLDTGAAPLATGRSALPVQALIEAIGRSARAGKRVPVERTGGGA